MQRMNLAAMLDLIRKLKDKIIEFNSLGPNHQTIQA